MKIITGSQHVPARLRRNTAVTIGVFDGVHRGHQHIFKKLVEAARRQNGMSLIYTFHPHPARVLVPDACPFMLNTLEQKLALLKAMGVDAVVVEPFTRAYARQTPEKFFKKIIVGRLGTKSLWVGYDFTFGVHRSGTLSVLKELAQASDVNINVIKPYLLKETIVSSTQIRQRLASGQAEAANDLLGHPYFMEGLVVQGRGVGGNLGIHTANLQPDNDLILPTGVYITRTEVLGRKYQSVTNIGPNPTFGPAPISIETHLLHFDRTIAKKKIRVEFLKKLREEITFPSAKELTVQIQNDIHLAQQYFTRRGRRS